MKRVLMVAFHYPPAFGSSGVQRTLKFSQYLPAHGWQPLVLTVHPRAHAKVNAAQLEEIPAEAVVERAFALDAGRHLAIRGRYPRAVALPDRWAAWLLGAVPRGLALIRKYRPQALWTTYPIATATLIGHVLHRLTGLPWVLDLRDPMIDDSFPVEPAIRRAHAWIERRAVAAAARIVVTTPGTERLYRARYGLPEGRTLLIPNGYDEDNFAQAASRAAAHAGPRPLTLVHSGILYPEDRDPTAFFAAVAALARRAVVTPSSLRITLRASGHDDVLQRMIDAAGVGDLVKLEPGIPYADALAEMLSADGLLVFQAASCNHQIPAKLYEYMRSGRPILAITDPAGDTAQTLRASGGATIARLDDAADIERTLEDFLARVRAGTATGVDPAVAARYSRRAQVATLAAALDEAAERRG